MDFLDIEINEKLFTKILIWSIIFIIIYLAFTMSSLLIFKSYTLGPNTSVNDEGINTHIDILEHDSKKIEIAGWAYSEDEPIGIVNCNYVLKNQETGKMYLMRTQMEENINIKWLEFMHNVYFLEYQKEHMKYMFYIKMIQKIFYQAH